MIKKIIKKLAVRFLTKSDLREIQHQTDKEFFARCILTNFENQNTLYSVLNKIEKEIDKKHPSPHAFRMCVAKILSEYNIADKTWLEVFFSASYYLDKNIAESAAKDETMQPEDRLKYIYTAIRDKFIPEPIAQPKANNEPVKLSSQSIVE